MNKKIKILIRILLFSVSVSYLSSNTELFNAVLGNKIGKIEELLDSGVDVNILGNFGLTALMCAVIGPNPSLDVINLLITRGANVHFRNKSGDTILMYSVRGLNSNLELIELGLVRSLIDAGADVNFQKTYNYTILMSAVNRSNPNLDVIRLLIDRGARVNFIDEYSRTAFKLAVNRSNPNLDVIRLLLDMGANIDMALMSAVKTSNQNLDVIRLLFNRGVDVNILDDNGSTALIYAVNRSNPNLDVIRLLIDMGAVVNFQDRLGRTVTYYARKSGLIGPNDTIQEWYSRDLLYNSRDTTSDFTVIVDGTEIPVHRDILSERSGLFRGMFEFAHDEGGAFVKYPGDLSLPALNALIEFIYIGHISNLTIDIARELLDNYVEEEFMLPPGELEHYLGRQLERQQNN